MTTGQVIKWWEFRRLHFNFALIAASLLAVLGIELLTTMVMSKGEDLVDPKAVIIGFALYLFAANLIYTFGWILELRGRKTSQGTARRRGKRTFRAGLMISCILTSFPFWFACIFCLFSP